MQSPEVQNAAYVSSKTQNEITEVTGNMILKHIVEEVKVAKFYTALADEVASHIIEHLPLCTWFVDSHKDI